LTEVVGTHFFQATQIRRVGILVLGKGCLVQTIKY